MPISDTLRERGAVLLKNRLSDVKRRAGAGVLGENNAQHAAGYR